MSETLKEALRERRVVYTGPLPESDLPAWPAKGKRRAVDRVVRLRHKLETKGGDIFEKGELLVVSVVNRGMTLVSVHTCPSCACRRRMIAKVGYHDVDLVPLGWIPPSLEGDA